MIQPSSASVLVMLLSSALVVTGCNSNGANQKSDGGSSRNTVTDSGVRGSSDAGAGMRDAAAGAARDGGVQSQGPGNRAGDAATVDDAGEVSSSDAGTACSDLTVKPAGATSGSASLSKAPATKGGTIKSGTYLFTKATRYGGCSGDAPLQAQGPAAVRFTATDSGSGAWEYVFKDGSHQSGTYALRPSDHEYVVFTWNCPYDASDPNATEPFHFIATSTEFAIVETGADNNDVVCREDVYAFIKQ